MTEDNTTRPTIVPSLEVQAMTPKRPFTCQIDGFVYYVENDSKPFLCMRCMRRIAKTAYRITREPGDD